MRVCMVCVLVCAHSVPESPPLLGSASRFLVGFQLHLLAAATPAGGASGGGGRPSVDVNCAWTESTEHGVVQAICALAVHGARSTEWCVWFWLVRLGRG